MKTYILLPLALVFLISCGNNSPEKRIAEFYKAISNNDSKLAQKYATIKTTEYIKENLEKPFDITVLNCETTSNIANCDFNRFKFFIIYNVQNCLPVPGFNFRLCNRCYGFRVFSI